MMKNIYRIEMMTATAYDNYLAGSYNYWIEKIDIEADSKEKAIAIAKARYPEMIINSKYVKSVAEIEEEKARLENTRRLEEECKANAKARKEAREREKAELLGLTLEEYKAKVKKEKAIKKLEKEIAELKEELAKAEKKLNNLKNRG